MAVYSLLHLPSAHAAQTLSGTLPFEARTFLPRFGHEDLDGGDRLAHFRAGILTKFFKNYLCFFEQSVFRT